MPKLDTPLHLDMLRTGKKVRALPGRIKQALKVLFAKTDVYGIEWGEPETNPPLTYVRDHFLLPYVTQDAIALEIGPGGGRWTRYMLGVKRLYAVDFHQELLDELKSNFDSQNLTFVKNNGNDFPGIPNGSIDFIFSYGVFVHLDVEIIDQYLRNMKVLLKPSSNVVIQYSDKSKPLGKSNKGFSQNDPDTMRRLVSSHGYFIYEEDIKTLWHSSLIRFGIREADVS
jgi:ubiquinone/menaquinone biosynthesis C-methylase UbiE